jgi:hypothetical protein
MSIFQKWPPRVEIFIHHHLFGVRAALFAGVSLPVWCHIEYLFIIVTNHYAADSYYIGLHILFIYFGNFSCSCICSNCSSCSYSCFKYLILVYLWNSFIVVVVVVVVGFRGWFFGTYFVMLP